MEDRLITSSWLAEDDQAEYSLRPRFLNEYIGQHGVKEHMRIYIEAAKHRGEPLDHALLYGPPGLGKNDAGFNNCKRDGFESARDFRAGYIACRRSCGHIVKACAWRRVVYR